MNFYTGLPVPTDGPSLAGKYNFKIVQKIAEGGFATIFKAENEKRHLVIKVNEIYLIYSVFTKFMFSYKTHI